MLGLFPAEKLFSPYMKLSKVHRDLCTDRDTAEGIIG